MIRKCTKTGGFITKGYVFRDGEAYFRHKHDAEQRCIDEGYRDFDDAHDEGAVYYTEWHSFLGAETILDIWKMDFLKAVSEMMTDDFAFEHIMYRHDAAKVCKEIFKQTQETPE